MHAISGDTCSIGVCVKKFFKSISLQEQYIGIFRISTFVICTRFRKIIIHTIKSLKISEHLSLSVQETQNIQINDRNCNNLCLWWEKATGY